MTDACVLDLDDADAAGPEIVGAKGWSLGRLRCAGFPTPAGFVVTTESYRRSVIASGIEPRLRTIWDAACSASPADIRQLASRARHLISAVKVEPAVALDIVSRVVAVGDEAEFVVRASAVPDGVSGPACTGVHATFTNVIGSEAVLSRLRGCWVSLYGERALEMRARGLGGSAPTMAVVVQPMLRAEKSGLAVPLRSSSDVLVEATFGLGEPLVTGAVEPDRYVVDSSTSTVRSVTVGRKQIVLPADARGRHAFAPLERQRQRALDDAEVTHIAELCRRVSTHFGGDHEVEWLIDGSGLAILQARPVRAEQTSDVGRLDGVIAGQGVGRGTATGPVRIVRSANDLASVSPGDVLVTVATVPEWRPHLLRAAAIVTDSGDQHSHAALVAKEHGIPAVVGSVGATSDLEDGATVTVDATHGYIFRAPVPPS